MDKCMGEAKCLGKENINTIDIRDYEGELGDQNIKADFCKLLEYNGNLDFLAEYLINYGNKISEIDWAAINTVKGKLTVKIKGDSFNLHQGNKLVATLHSPVKECRNNIEGLKDENLLMNILTQSERNFISANQGNAYPITTEKSKNYYDKFYDGALAYTGDLQIAHNIAMSQYKIISHKGTGSAVQVAPRVLVTNAHVTALDNGFVQIVDVHGIMRRGKYISNSENWKIGKGGKEKKQDLSVIIMEDSSKNFIPLLKPGAGLSKGLSLGFPGGEAYTSEGFSTSHGEKLTVKYKNKYNLEMYAEAHSAKKFSGK